MKKVIALFAASFFLVSANYAQTTTGSTGTATQTGTGTQQDTRSQGTQTLRSNDTSMGSHKSQMKNIHKGKSRMNTGTNGTLSPMNNGSGRANPSNSGNSTSNPGQTQTPSQSTTPGQTTTPNHHNLISFQKSAMISIQQAHHVYLGYAWITSPK